MVKYYNNNKKIFIKSMIYSLHTLHFNKNVIVYLKNRDKNDVIVYNLNLCVMFFFIFCLFE